MNQTVPQDPNKPGIKVMLGGVPGVGKTHSIHTLAQAGLETFVIFTEQGNILHQFNDPRIHWAQANPHVMNVDEMSGVFDLMSKLTTEAIMSSKNVNKQFYAGAIPGLFGTLKNFVDQNGREFGPVDKWETDRVLVIDGLSGLTEIARGHSLGAKPHPALNEYSGVQWGIAQIVNYCTVGLKCHFVLLCHWERIPDEVSGGHILMPKAFGKALGPDLPRNFTDVVHAERRGDKFSWSTVTHNADLKARNMPYKGGQPPSFAPLVDYWKSTGGVITPTEAPASQPQLESKQ